jgi:hypothetical protein
MEHYTYFYIHSEKGVMLSPFFDNEEDAKLWLERESQKLQLRQQS